MGNDEDRSPKLEGFCRVTEDDGGMLLELKPGPPVHPKPQRETTGEEERWNRSGRVDTDAGSKGSSRSWGLAREGTVSVSAGN